MAALTPAATESVEAAPFLKTVNSVLRTPSCRTMFSCGIIAVAHLCHVAYMNHGAAHHFDRQIVQQIDPRRIDVEINRHFFSADLGRAARIGERAIADGSDDVGFDEVIGFQRLEIEIDRNHTLLAAIWIGNADVPGTLISPTRIWFRAMSKTCCSESLVLLIPN